ncbi:MAG: class I SAM-dependent methyltransferase [Rhodobacteraceae bacterium]|nr:class I SAM-dependent methyltransferase [Paracoccaceae bacterium]
MTSLDQFRNFERDGWNSAARQWHELWGPLSRQSTEPLLDAAGVKSGHHVLDLAAGPGYAAAAAITRGATSIGVDIAAAQVELARALHPGPTFQEGSAEALDFPDCTFDAIVMAFGMNHMAEPEKCLAECHRVLKPGGRFAFTVWTAPPENQAFDIIISAINAHGSIPAEKYPGPPYFFYADPQNAESAFSASGYMNFSSEIVPQMWHHQITSDLYDSFERGAVRATALLSCQSPDALNRIKSASSEAVEKLRKNGEICISAPAALMSAQKPA